MSVAGSATRVVTTASLGRRGVGSAPRLGASRSIAPAVYRRRRRIVGAAVTLLLAVLLLGTTVLVTGAGLGVASANLFTPLVLVPASMGSLVSLVRYHRSGNGGGQPASPAPVAGSRLRAVPFAQAA